MAVFLAPDPINSTQFLPGSNTPATGALLFCYQNKTSTKMNSYSDPTASTANTNPIVLNSGGNPPQEIWIASTATFVLAPSNDGDPPTSPYRTWNDIPGINNVSALIAASLTGEWVQGSTVTFIGVTAFSVVGDQTALYTLGRRIKATVTGGDRFGIVTSSVLAGASTAVGVTLDSSTLNGGLSSVQYGLLSTPNGSVPWTTITPVGNIIQGFLTPTTTAPLGFGISSSGPAVFVNSTQIFDFTSTEAHAVGVLRLSSTLVFSPAVSQVIPGTTSFSIRNSSNTVDNLLIVDAGLTTVRASFAVKNSTTDPVASTGAIRLSYAASVKSHAHTTGIFPHIDLVQARTIGSITDICFVGSGSTGFMSVSVITSTNPTTSDVPVGVWTLWNNTAISTTRFYFNNGGVLVSSAIFT